MDLCAFCKRTKETAGKTRADQVICVGCAEAYNYCRHCGSLDLPGAGGQKHFKDNCALHVFRRKISNGAK